PVRIHRHFSEADPRAAVAVGTVRDVSLRQPFELWRSLIVVPGSWFPGAVAAGRTLLQDANLVAVVPAGILATRIAAAATHRLHSHPPAHALLVFHGDEQRAGLRQREHLAAPGVHRVDARIARHATHSRGAQIHGPRAVEDDLAAVGTEDVSVLNLALPRNKGPCRIGDSRGW